MDLKDASWKYLKETLPVKLDVSKFAEHNIHGIEVGKTFDSNQTPFATTLVTMDSNDLPIS